jgi:hypothetical protein
MATPISPGGSRLSFRFALLALALALVLPARVSAADDDEYPWAVGVDVTAEEPPSTGTVWYLDIMPFVRFQKSCGDFALVAAAGLGLSYDIPQSGTLSDPSRYHPFVAITPSYGFTIGPGDLRLSLGINVSFFLRPDGSGVRDNYAPEFVIYPALSYDMETGFGALFFSLGVGDDIIHGHPGSIGGVFFEGLLFRQIDDNYESPPDIPFSFQAAIDFPFGLGFTAIPLFDFRSVHSLAVFTFDVRYALSEVFTLGSTFGIPLSKDELNYDPVSGTESYVYARDAISIIPYIAAGFGAFTAYLDCTIDNLKTKPKFSPSISVIYRF